MQQAEPPGFKIAIVGASTLKGKEIKEALERRRFPARRLLLLDEEDIRGQLTEFQGEPAVIGSLERDSFEGMEFVFLAASPVYSRNVWKLADRAGCRIIDLTEALEQEGACIAGPLATGALPDSSGRVYVSAHPAALVIASLLRRTWAAGLTPRRTIVHVFEPASERGSAGIEELHQQTVALLSFHELPKEVFGSQLAFNLLAAYGEEIGPLLAGVEERVAGHLARLLPSGIAPPSLRVLQSATFHGHAFSFYLELEQRREAAEVEAAFAGTGYDLRRAGQEAPSAVGSASSEEIMVGDIRPDKNHPGAWWIWAAADNLRLAAVNAVRIAEELAKSKAP